MIRTIPFTRGVVLWLCACCGVAATQTPQTLNQLRKEAAAQSQAAQAQSDGTGRLRLAPLQGADSTPAMCPNAAALNLFKHQIAYQRTEELDPFRGLRELHADVWQRGPLTAFYMRDKLNEFAASVRMADLFGKSGLQSGGTCPVEKNWRECVEDFAGMEYANYVVATCSIVLDMRAIPAWKPSPNDQAKQRIADELRSEIEGKWPGVREIVIRDFNLEDNQIVMYLKMPDGDNYQGCGFHAMSEPHCENWHLFGMAPNSSIRKRIFELPYRLK